MHKYDLILFDMDGTIAYSDPMMVETWHRLYKRFKPKRVCNDYEILYFSGPPMVETLTNEFPDYKLEVVYNAWAEISLDCTNQGLITNFPYVKEAVSRFIEKGIKVGVVTNKKTSNAYRVLEKLDLRDVFPLCLGSDDVVNSKPYPDGILKAMEISKINDKSRVLYVGDNTIDYETAKNSGVDCALLTWGPREFKSGTKPTYFVKDYRELEAIICG